ncbi:hypothetical protein ACFV98_17815 [Streptomyces violascens]|uniref:hypothetical protein n=1 Tax=Streptomyces violascens TaxID=67381 RepID=UPI00365C529C
MKPTRAEELYFDPEPDLFMLTQRELADRALALAAACCRRAEKTATLDGPAVTTAFRSVRLAVALARRRAAPGSCSCA